MVPNTGEQIANTSLIALLLFQGERGADGEEGLPVIITSSTTFK